jgi:hypothetical protein
MISLPCLTMCCFLVCKMLEEYVASSTGDESSGGGVTVRFRVPDVKIRLVLTLHHVIRLLSNCRSLLSESTLLQFISYKGQVRILC